MSINLIDTLLEEQPFINDESRTIHSEISLTEIIGTTQDNSEYVFLPAYLDQVESERRMRQYGNSGLTYRYIDHTMSSDVWKRLELSSFIISKKLVNFLVNDCENYSINKLFKLKLDSMNDKKIMVKIFTMLVSKYNYLKEDEGGYLVYGEKGNRIRYGKFINMLLDILYNGNSYHRQQEVERSVDVYKSKFSASQYKICVLNGDDIKLGYDRRYQSKSRETMLGKSCMNDKLDLLKLYTINPKKIYLFIVTDYDGKIISRNLMWRLNKYNNFLFDRVYAIDNFVRRIVENLARNENWILYQEGRGIQEIFKLDDQGESKIVNGNDVSIKLNFNGVKLFPYLDTFHHQRIWNNRLTNKNFYRFSYKYYNTNGRRDKII